MVYTIVHFLVQGFRRIQFLEHPSTLDFVNQGILKSPPWASARLVSRHALDTRQLTLYGGMFLANPRNVITLAGEFLAFTGALIGYSESSLCVSWDIEELFWVAETSLDSSADW